MNRQEFDRAVKVRVDQAMASYRRRNRFFFILSAVVFIAAMTPLWVLTVQHRDAARPAASPGAQGASQQELLKRISDLEKGMMLLSKLDEERTKLDAMEASTADVEKAGQSIQNARRYFLLLDPEEQQRRVELKNRLDAGEMLTRKELSDLLPLVGEDGLRKIDEALFRTIQLDKAIIE